MPSASDVNKEQVKAWHPLWIPAQEQQAGQERPLVVPSAPWPVLVLFQLLRVVGAVTCFGTESNTNLGTLPLPMVYSGSVGGEGGGTMVSLITLFHSFTALEYALERSVDLGRPGIM